MDVVTDAQIRSAYDAIGQVYRPWTQWFQPPNVQSPVVCTDGYGFRKTFTTYRSDSDLPVNVLLGSSAVFGVGASRDGHTLTAWLGRLTNEPWLNFGGRAFNSTQELILFLLHRPKRIKRLVVCSGVNTLTLGVIAPTVSPIDGAFFTQSVVEGVVRDGTMGFRTALNAVWQAIRGQGICAAMEPQDARYTASVACLIRDWRALRDLVPAIRYVLQPCATWLRKAWTPKELARFARPSKDHLVLAELARLREPFTADLTRAFPMLTDANRDWRFQGGEDLFFDRVHLTDRGYERLAEVIAEAL